MEKRPQRPVEEVDPATRVEVFSGIVSQVDKILAVQPEIKNPFIVNAQEQTSLKTWLIPNSDYRITRDLKIDTLEVIIGKVRVDELLGESREEVRIRVGRAGISQKEPSFEYYRNVHNQRRRNLRPNTVGTISAVERFLRRMQQSLTPSL